MITPMSYMRLMAISVTLSTLIVYAMARYTGREKRALPTHLCIIDMFMLNSKSVFYCLNYIF